MQQEYQKTDNSAKIKQSADKIAAYCIVKPSSDYFIENYACTWNFICSLLKYSYVNIINNNKLTNDRKNS